MTVCTANICRSPAAQVYLARALGGYSVQVHSAGTLALDHNQADSTMQNLLTEQGYPEIGRHRSRALMPSHLMHYDLILCMAAEHMEWVHHASPTSTGKMRLLGHWAGQKDVEDPIGRSQKTYALSLEEIKRFSDQWADKLVTMGMVS